MRKHRDNQGVPHWDWDRGTLGFDTRHVRTEQADSTQALRQLDLTDHILEGKCS